MSDATLRDQAVAELKLTTVGYINKKWTVPPPGTHWANALALLAQIGTTPPQTHLKGMYSSSPSAWPTTQSETGSNMLIAGADDTNTLSILRAAGAKMWGKAGYWNDATGQFSMTDAQALAVAQNVKANWSDVVVGWYVADEPTNSAANRTTVQNRSNLLKSGFPVETLIAYYDAASLSQWKGVVDAFALDIYPSRANWNMQLIPQLAAAADAAGLKYYGVVGAFTAPNYPLPTASQLQQMIDLWKATKQSGWVTYAWGNVGGSPQLENCPDLLAVLKANG